jgi:thymidine kinase
MSLLWLILGPMFSGKSTYLLSYETRFKLAHKRVLIVKHSIDTRYSTDSVATHNGAVSQQTAVCCSQLSDISTQLVDASDAVLIDEGQFFPDLHEWCRNVLKGCKHIIIAGLSGDYKQEPFQSIVQLTSMADRIVHLHSICTQCGDDAPFTIRLSHEREQTVVGAADKYQPRCRKCLHL